MACLRCLFLVAGSHFFFEFRYVESSFCTNCNCSIWQLFRHLQVALIVDLQKGNLLLLQIHFQFRFQFCLSNGAVNDNDSQIRAVQNFLRLLHPQSAQCSFVI